MNQKKFESYVKNLTQEILKEQFIGIQSHPDSLKKVKFILKEIEKYWNYYLEDENLESLYNCLKKITALKIQVEAIYNFEKK